MCRPVPPSAYRNVPKNAGRRAVRAGADIPPLIVQYTKDGFELCDGNHRFEAYTRLGLNAAFVIVWMTEKEEYAAFMDRFAAYFE